MGNQTPQEPAANVSFIHLSLRPGVRDVVGERVAADCSRYLQLDTGAVSHVKVFAVLTPLASEELQLLADRGLRDEVIHEVQVVRDSSLALDSLENHSTYVLVARLPGVTDDEGASAEKTLADLLSRPQQVGEQQIFVSDLYLLEKPLGDEELGRIAREVLGNELIHHFQYGDVTGFEHYVPFVAVEADATIETVDIFVPDEQLAQLSKRMVLSLSIEEMRAIQAYYRDPAVARRRAASGLPPHPTDCELEVLAQTWSEHCCHKEFNALIHYRDADTGEERTVDSLFKSYIRGSTEEVQRQLEANGESWLVKVFSDNAGVVRIDDDRLFVWKVETHNTPSALDPYGGAITGIVGNNRDPMGTGIGGARLLFNTNVLCFGPPDYDKPLLTGQLHPRRVFAGVVHGIEDGGNKSGIPTVNGAIVFDDRYAGKPLVYCGTGGVMPAAYGDRNSWEKKIDPGDCIVMAGGRVGKDGIHGATFSSAEIDKHSPRTAVQIGSPITQKLMSDFMEEACRQGLVKCSTDNGAGGLSSSVGELATISGGALVNLEKAPLKYSGLKPWEIFVSESQERMTLVIEEQCINDLFALAARYEVELSHLGWFDDSGYLEVRYEGRTAARLDLEFLHNGVPRKELWAEWRSPELSEPELPCDLDYGQLLERLLASLNICSRESVIRRYDHEVKGRTVVKPLMGGTGKGPQDAAVMRLGFDDFKGIAVSNGIIPRYGDLDAYHMSAGAFDEAVRQIIAVGGSLPSAEQPGVFWSVNDNFCVPDSVFDEETNPDGKYKLAQLVRMCEALYDMAVAYGIPMTSGKDSMKNDFRADGQKISVPPTILYSMVAALEDVRSAVTSDFKAAGDLLYLLGETADELGGSELYGLLGETGANVPRVRVAEALDLYRRVAAATGFGLLESCHDLSDGGLAVALAECTFGGTLGANIDLPDFGVGPVAELFSESHSRFLATVQPDATARFEALMGPRARLLGEVNADSAVRIKHEDHLIIDTPVRRLLQAWTAGLEY